MIWPLRAYTCNQACDHVVNASQVDELPHHVTHEQITVQTCTLPSKVCIKAQEGHLKPGTVMMWRQNTGRDFKRQLRLECCHMMRSCAQHVVNVLMMPTNVRRNANCSWLYSWRVHLCLVCFCCRQSTVELWYSQCRFYIYVMLLFTHYDIMSCVALECQTAEVLCTLVLYV